MIVLDICICILDICIHTYTRVCGEGVLHELDDRKPGQDVGTPGMGVGLC